ncbi:hypothetical protein O3M35_005434 [Rhynocoris fuscipes]|uniref:Uncharacterized protein n=1 Tax=Rhynocoris fuscipes TaxID=488301 RepID=A0AAW1DQC6_9HEMI
MQIEGECKVCGTIKWKDNINMEERKRDEMGWDMGKTGNKGCGESGQAIKMKMSRTADESEGRKMDEDNNELVPGLYEKEGQQTEEKMGG